MANVLGAPRMLVHADGVTVSPAAPLPVNVVGGILITDPATGTYAAGDRVLNSAPAVGSPKGWICTVGGTPGTWVSEGNL